MKCIMLPQVVFSSAVLALCGLTLACGAGYPSSPLSVSSTQNPLVAEVYIASSCAGTASVAFGPDVSYGRTTASYPVQAGNPGINILVAGMRASTTYHMLPSVQCASGSTLPGQDLIFQTGALPSLPFPTLTVTRPSPSSSSPENPGIEMIDVIAPTANEMQAYFTDRDANPIWYYDVGAASGNYPETIKILPNGHVILSITTATTSILREVDLAGNTIHELDMDILAQKMQQARYDFIPQNYHHDVLPLDNGHLIVLVNFTKPYADLPGYPGTTQVVGDGLIDLDANWNPVWAWNSFDYLDVNRHLNGLPDWTHSNAIVYSPSDGNLLLSMRHQSWVLKIDYEDGSGSGNVLWHLGDEGDFSLAVNNVPTTDATQWFSFQHFPSIISQSGAQTTLAIWDNGDFRATETAGVLCGYPTTPPCYSRATIFQVDESAMVANLFWDNLPGWYGFWGGSINQLENGNVEYDINALTDSTTVASEVQEVTQTSAPQIVWKMDFAFGSNAYRAYRVPSLYPGVTWQY
jgi:arylsulfate sulfotransferase